MKSLKNILLILLLWSFSTGNAQDFSDDWIGHFSFNEVTDVVRGNNRIYGASENAVFVFSTLTGTIQTLTTVNGLSGNRISSIFFSENFDTLLIGYENGIIDVLVGNSTDVLTVIDIFNRPAIPPDRKRINNFMEFNGFVYISAGFGISLYDLGQLEFDDTYFIGDQGALLNITQTALFDQYVYAASTDGGLRRAIASNTNIIDFNNWETVLSGSFQGLVNLQDRLFLLQDNLVLRSVNGINFGGVNSFASTIRAITANDEFVSIVAFNQIRVLDVTGTLINNFPSIEGFNNSYRASVIDGNELFVGTDRSGVIRIPLDNPDQISQLLPNGPLDNNIFAIAAAPGNVHVAFGDFSNTFNPFPLVNIGLSSLSLEEGVWGNLLPDELLTARNFTNITVNPTNPSQVFYSSFIDGLLETIDGVPTILYDENNSTFVPTPSTLEDVRINGGAFDRDGNLWISNSRVGELLHRLSPNGQFTAIDFGDILPDPNGLAGITDVVVSPDGNIFMASAGAGLLGYNPSTDQTVRLFGEDGAANLPIDDIRSLAIDRNGTLWIGTRLGLRLLFNPSAIFEDQPVSTTAIIFNQDGLNQELLNDQVITDIFVDGANNKWVATTDSGVFNFSPNGDETLFHFTTSNSPLPTNNVQGIAIDEETGTVYFGTTQGLVAFRGTSTAPAEDLENVVVFPNPVRPTFNGLVTIDGLTANTNVKITDLVGNLVHEENTTGGNITWDTTAFGRHRVASGVYLILITGPNALETQVSKLMIIR